MYSIDKIKDALLCHKNKDLYKLTIDNILNLLQIALRTKFNRHIMSGLRITV
jgi:hypothetical protein